MKLIPFAGTILWKSWANRAIGLSLGCFAGFAAISATPAEIMAFVPVVVVIGAKYVFATGGFVAGVASPFLRVVAQNFGEDAKGNQIVSAIGVAPAGTDPTPPVVVSMDVAKTPEAADMVVSGTARVG
jgi:hypothetical protein